MSGHHRHCRAHEDRTTRSAARKRVRAARRRRRLLEGAVENIIEYLDEIDGDPDHEPSTDDEPSLGWANPGAPSGALSGGGIDMD